MVFSPITKWFCIIEFKVSFLAQSLYNVIKIKMFAPITLIEFQMSFFRHSWYVNKFECILTYFGV